MNSLSGRTKINRLHKIDNDVIFLVSVFICPILLLSWAGMHKVIPCCFGIVCFWSLANRPRNVFLLYVILLPTNGIILREDYLFGIIGIQQIVGSSLLFYLLDKRNYFSKKKSMHFSEVARRILLLLITYLAYTNLKEAFWGIGGKSYIEAVKTIINVIPLYVPLYYMLKWEPMISHHYDYESLVLTGTLNMAFFTAITPFLEKLGLYTAGVYEFQTGPSSGLGTRFFGVIGNGDVNSLGVFFVIVIGYLLSKEEPFRSLKTNAMIFISIGAIALSASRTAFVSLILVVMIFLIIDKQASNSIKIVCVIAVAGIVLFPFWEAVFDRFLMVKTELATSGTSSRLSKWIAYLKFLNANPMAYLAGTDHMLKLGWENTYRASHNFYIQMVYNGGVFFLLVLFVQYFRLVKLAMRKTACRLFLVLTPYFLITLYVSDFMTALYFLIIVSMNTQGLDQSFKEVCGEECLTEQC